MRLTDARKLFNKLRADSTRILVRPHAYKDHPDRRFSVESIRSLVQGLGNLFDNKTAARATAGSFIWKCKDEAHRPCEIIVTFDARNGDPNEFVVVISAYREMKS